MAFHYCKYKSTNELPKDQKLNFIIENGAIYICNLSLSPILLKTKILELLNRNHISKYYTNNNRITSNLPNRISPEVNLLSNVNLKVSKLSTYNFSNENFIKKV